MTKVSSYPILVVAIGRAVTDGEPGMYFTRERLADEVFSHSDLQRIGRGLVNQAWGQMLKDGRVSSKTHCEFVSASQRVVIAIPPVSRWHFADDVPF